MIKAPSPVPDADALIAGCLHPNVNRSFFLAAGAGAGKTRSLVEALRVALSMRGRDMLLNGQQIAVITYTNAAADEISQRLQHDPRVSVSTIHSFAWTLAQTFQTDIREWKRAVATADLAKLESSSSRAGTKAEAERVRKVERTRSQLENLDGIRRFTYNPSGDNGNRESLSHEDVLMLTTHLLESKPLFAELLTSRHPVLFIDECQDTKKSFLEALLRVEADHRNAFVLGLFGDTMQRIYNGGKVDLLEAIPEDWAQPIKPVNHRSQQRIVDLNNRIRSVVDAHEQVATAEHRAGVARLYITGPGADREQLELDVARSMAIESADQGWNVLPGKLHSGLAVKRLILEHSMAASRLGFGILHAALKQVPGDTGYTSEMPSELRVFALQVLPLIQASGIDDAYEVMRILREHSPLMGRVAFTAVSSEVTLGSVMALAQTAVAELLGLWDGGADPTLAEVSAVLLTSNLFELHANVELAFHIRESGGTDDGVPSVATSAWSQVLDAPMSELEAYSQYVSGNTAFATHQGVKGLEFPRVMVVISDDEAGGFLFSYEKLFESVPESDADRRNSAEGKETSLDRTRRLMYVVCSRAADSLAVVAYTANPEAVRQFAIDNGWFSDDEIELIP